MAKKDDVDYRKLLKLSMQTQFEVYGVCGFIDENISKSERKIINEIYKEFRIEGVIKA